MSSDDSSPRVGSTRRLIGSLRNVLFESTPQTAAALVSATVALRDEGTDSDVEAARQVLRSSVEAELGPGVREFALQNQALLELLPDPALRRKAALRVLSLKGTSPLHLSIELDQALATLSAQGEAFAHKVQERRAALEAGQRSCSEQYQQQTADAEQAMARLRAELDAHGVALTRGPDRARPNTGRERGFALGIESP